MGSELVTGNEEERKGKKKEKNQEEKSWNGKQCSKY